MRAKHSAALIADLRSIKPGEARTYSWNWPGFDGTGNAMRTLRRYVKIACPNASRREFSLLRANSDGDVTVTRKPSDAHRWVDLLGDV